MKTAVVLALAGAAISAPTRTVEHFQLPGVGSESGTDSGLGALKSLTPGLSGGSSTGIPSFPHFSGLPGLGGSGGSSSGLPKLPSFSDLPGLGGSGGSGNLPSIPTGLPGLGGSGSSGLPSLPDPEGSGSKNEATQTDKRQFPGLGSGSGGLSSLESLIPSLGGSSTSGSGLSSLIPSLGGSSTSGGGLSALESLLPSAGSSTGLGFKARRDAIEIEKRQLGTLTSLFPALSNLGSSSSSSSDSTSSSSESSSSSGFSIPGLSNISKPLRILKTLKAKYRV